MNQNTLDLTNNSYGFIEEVSGIQKFTPCSYLTAKKSYLGLRVLEVDEETGFFTAHLIDNWNEDGEFRTELVRFTNEWIADEEDLERRNQIRIAHGLMEVGL